MGPGAAAERETLGSCRLQDPEGLGTLCIVWVSQRSSCLNYSRPMRGTLPLGKSLGYGQRADDHAGRGTAFITFWGALKYTSPRDEVHDRFVAICCNTSENRVSPLTLASHGCWSTACIGCAPCRPPFCYIHCRDEVIWSGKAELASTMAIRLSGNRAMGATSW